MLTARSKWYGDALPGVRVQLEPLGEADPELRAMTLEDVFTLPVRLHERDALALLELMAKDPDERVRSLALLLLGDLDTIDEERSVPTGLLVRLLSAGLADESARVRESAALVLREARVARPGRASKLPPLPWNKPGQMTKWPLAMVAGRPVNAKLPKRMPPWVAEEVVRRLRHRFHPQAHHGVRLLNAAPAPIPEVVINALWQRVRRASGPVPGGLRLLAQVVGVDDQTRPVLEAALESGSPGQREEAFEALAASMTPCERLELIAGHLTNGHVRRAVVRWLMIRVPEDALAECEPTLDWLASHEDPDIARAARHALEHSR
jgi:hypothetical protein